MDAEADKRQALTVISEQLAVIADAGYDTDLLRAAMWKFTKAFAAAYFAEKLIRNRYQLVTELQSSGASELDSVQTDVYVIDTPFKRKRIVLRPEWPFTALIDCPGGICEVSGQDAESLHEIFEAKVAKGTSTGRYLIIDWNAKQVIGAFPELAGKFETRKLSEI